MGEQNNWQEHAVFFDWARKRNQKRLENKTKRALFAEWVNRWNTTIRSGKCVPGQQNNMEFARSWYMHNQHMKPGEAAVEISSEIERLFPDPNGPGPDVRTIKKWIKDQAPAGVSGRGRPRKK
jgi:hypothetical protein